VVASISQTTNADQPSTKRLPVAIRSFTRRDFPVDSDFMATATHGNISCQCSFLYGPLDRIFYNFSGSLSYFGNSLGFLLSIGVKAGRQGTEVQLGFKYCVGFFKAKSRSRWKFVPLVEAL